MNKYAFSKVVEVVEYNFNPTFLSSLINKSNFPMPLLRIISDYAESVKKMRFELWDEYCNWFGEYTCGSCGGR